MDTYRILIVEDHPDTRELLSQQLDQPNYQLILAADGQEAILKIGKDIPDLVIMDIMMPQLDGLETCRYLKLRFRPIFLPIVILSAKSNDQSRRQGALYSCDDYQTKPYSLQSLRFSVEHLLKLGVLERKRAKLEPHSPAWEQTVQDIAKIRYPLAKRLLEDRSPDLAKMHLKQVLQWIPNHPESLELLQHIEEQDEV